MLSKLAYVLPSRVANNVVKSKHLYSIIKFKYKILENNKNLRVSCCKTHLIFFFFFSLFKKDNGLFLVTKRYYRFISAKIKA